MAIRQLDPLTIAKIAAGEVVLSPVSALKELMENSLDAGATALELVVKDGGLGLLQVKDNGGGILTEDLPLLCVRFTTSKLKTLEDLETLTTFGFRGEALASISHVAFVTVCTRTKDDANGHKAEYRSGEMLGEPRVYPMLPGTTISAERMFEQLPGRRETLGTASELFLSCLKVVQRYALQYHTVQFTLGTGDKKPTLTTSGSSTRVQLLQLLYDHPAMDLEVIPVHCAVGEAAVDGIVSNANYSRAGSEFILFVNGRLVENEALQCSVTKTYLTLLPNSAHFVYLSLTVPPATLDPNVHPTKREVKFTAETEVFTAIQQCIETEFNKSQQQRTLLVRTLGPAVSRKGPSQQVRTSHTDSQLDWTIKKVSNPEPQKLTEDLASVHELKTAIASEDAVQAIFDEFTFVGTCDRDRVLLQFRTGLYLVHAPAALQELAYQHILANFAKLPRTEVEPVHVPSLLEATIDEPWTHFDPSVHGDRAEVLSSMCSLLDRHSALLSEYFSLEISSQTLTKLPVVCSGNLVGSPEHLGELLLRLATDVDWSTEKPCIEGVARELARWFSQPPEEHEGKPLEELYRTQMFPYLRGRLKVDRRYIGLGGAVVKLVSTEELYQIFERC